MNAANAVFPAPVNISLGSAAAPSIAFTGDINTGIYSPGADQLAISTGGSARLFVNAAGCVGINKTPGAGAGLNQRLQIKQTGDVYDGLQIEKFDDDSVLAIGVYNSVWTFNATFNTTGSYLPIRFFTSGTERLRITAAGLVGIGTTAPGKTLDVNGESRSTVATTVNNSAAWYTAGDPGGYLYLGNGIGNPASIESYAPSSRSSATELALRFKTVGAGGSAATAMTIDSSQRVGIGTTSPSEALTVAGNIRANNTNAAIGAYGVNSSSPQFILGNSAGTAHYLIYETVDGSGNRGALSIYDAVAATSRLTVDTSGRLLVGTSTANTSGAKLQTVDGITFPATQVASADPNTLDDYEEGTWTPTWGTQINAPNGATGLTVVNANYTKIGTLVHVRATIALVGASGTFAANTTIIIAGLPFTTVNRSGSTAFSSGGGDYATWVGQVDTSAIRIAAATINGTASTNNIHVAATYVST